MAQVNAKCTDCGKIVQVDRNKDAWVCPQCGTPFIVEKAIKKYKKENTVIQVHKKSSDLKERNDFEIVDGVLIKYTGKSEDVLRLTIARI